MSETDKEKGRTDDDVYSPIAAEEDVQVEIRRLLDDETGRNVQKASEGVQAASIAEVAFWIVGSVGSSVGIIIVLKFVMFTYQFGFVLALTFCHFFCQMVTLETGALLKLFEVKRLPWTENFTVASSMVASVMFMNYSLRTNSVGFYQVTKLACIPCMVAIESSYYGKTFSRKIKLTLAVVIIGVATAVVTDVEFNVIGFCFGALAVIFTTQFQIWTGAKQKEYGLQGLQFQHSQAHAVTIIVGILCVIFEVIIPDRENSLLYHDFTAPEVVLILVSCLLAIAVNVTSASLIGKTSAVTYQVVGHMKTCLVLIGGFLLFPIVATSSELAKNICGILTAMAGVILYGHLKLTEQQKLPDCCDNHCWPSCLSFLNEK